MSDRSILASLPPRAYRLLVVTLRLCQDRRLALYPSGWVTEARREPCVGALATVHFDGAMWVHYVQHERCRHFSLFAAMDDAARGHIANNALQPGARDRLIRMAMGGLVQPMAMECSIVRNDLADEWSLRSLGHNDLIILDEPLPRVGTEDPGAKWREATATPLEDIRRGVELPGWPSEEEK